MSSPSASSIPESQFVNEVRVNLRQWVLAVVLVSIIVLLTPWLWTKLERFEIGADYRLPYSLSKDYWLYARRLGELNEAKQIPVLGDSVVWGEYVRPDGSLSHFLNEQAGGAGSFANAGVNGQFPLALEGLVRYYGGAIRDRKVLLHCNLLWMTSPKVDLSAKKEEKFNHVGLVPQFAPRIPCYRAEIADRLGIVIGRQVPFMAWVDHLQTAYFDQQNILAWTLAGNGSDAASYTNAYKNPLAQITRRVPTAPADDPERGPRSPRHKPWSGTGQGTQRFEWVDLNASLQWGAFQRLTEILRARHNSLLVVVGPFNEHIMAAENRAAFRKLRDGAVQWLQENKIAFAVLETLPSELYADASHPLTEGYERMAKSLAQDAAFQNWLKAR